MSWVTNAVSGSARTKEIQGLVSLLFFTIFFLEKSYCARSISIRDFLTDRKILLGALFFNP